MKKNLYTTIAVSLFFIGIAYTQEANIYLDLGIKKFVGKQSTLDRKKYFGIKADKANTNFTTSNIFFKDRPEVSPSLYAIEYPLKGSLSEDDSNFKHPFVANIQGLDLNSNTSTSNLADEIAVYFRFLSKKSNVILNTSEVTDNTSNNGLIYKNLGSKIDATKSPVLLSSPLLNTNNLSTDDFATFNTSIKPFIDFAGKEVDQYHLDITDGVDTKTQSIAYRSGANIEATFDLINTYNFSKHNKIKPFFIESYGLKFDQWLSQEHSNYNDALMIESLNNQVMALLDRPDNITIALPNIYANPEAKPNPYSVITKKAAANYTTTDLVKFYDFWKDAVGDRTYITSDHPDIQVNAFKNGTKWINIFNNLSDATQTLNLKFSEYDAERISKYTLKRIYTNANGIAEITEANTDIHIDQLDIEPFETFMLILDIPEDSSFATSIVEYNNYSKSYLKPIKAEEPIVFEIGNTVIGKGRANIRLSFGRDRKLSRYPIVTLNENVVLTPENCAGYDQANREDFFGTLLIPVPLSYVSENNKISIRFPDDGGYVSSVVINTEIFSKDVKNENFIEKNAPVFASHGGILLNVSPKLECSAPKILTEDGNTVKKVKGYHSGSTIDISTLKTGKYVLKLKNGETYPFKK